MTTQVEQLSQWYDDGTEGAYPTTEQWEAILALPADKPIVLINFFKLREKAHYLSSADRFNTEISGEEAFNQYAQVSIPTMERVGGKFLHVGTYKGMFIGEDEFWDVIAIGSYPNLKTLLALYQDESYRQSFIHRTAACEQ